MLKRIQWRSEDGQKNIRLTVLLFFAFFGFVTSFIDFDACGFDFTRFSLNTTLSFNCSLSLIWFWVRCGCFLAEKNRTSLQVSLWCQTMSPLINNTCCLLAGPVSKHPSLFELLSDWSSFVSGESWFIKSQFIHDQLWNSTSQT